MFDNNDKLTLKSTLIDAIWLFCKHNSFKQLLTKKGEQNEKQ